MLQSHIDLANKEEISIILFDNTVDEALSALAKDKGRGNATQGICNGNLHGSCHVSFILESH